MHTASPGKFLFALHITYILAMDTEFEWDPAKAESNYQKHGVSFAEAATVFFDLLSITVVDRCIPRTPTVS
ncbi:MAG TPA: BrnT family toxin [Pyrinomonadaceae bacterium]|nr:BrnT family toxin [Pyrinomonadaceae bacterium]